MIITCPSCSTRYLVNPASLGSEGRMVRCARCGHTWMERPGEPPPPPPDDLEPPPASIRPIPPGSNLPARPRPRRRERRSARAAWWAVLAAVVAALGLGAVAARERVVAVWPGAAPLYEALGMPVETLGAGLELREVRSERRVEDGATVLVIQGQIANVSDRERAVPGLRALALGPGQARLREWDVEPSRDRLFPGEVATFESVLRDPDEAIAEIAIAFREP